MPSFTDLVSLRDACAPLAIAIDVGTSSARVAVFDAKARLVQGTSTRSAHEVTTDRAGAATLEPDAVLDAVARSIDATLRRLGGHASDLAVVGTSVFWHGLMGIGARGRPTTPLFTWADMRARDAARALAARLDADAFHARTGCYLHSTYPAVKLRWLRDRRGTAESRTAKWLSFGEYLSLRFAGVAQVSHSVASATGMYEHARAAWDTPTLDAIGVAPGELSVISDALIVGLRPAFARRWPALARIPWLPGIGDGALANVGSGCATPERAAISLGTSGAVRACYRAGRGDAPRGLWQYRLDQRYVVVGGAVNNGGNAIEWSERVWHGAVPVGVDHGLTVVPLFAGERSPWWDDTASATIAGLRLATRPADIAAALVESVALRLAAAAEALIESRPRIERLVASGGVFVKRPELAQVVADAVGRPVSLASDPEASARGAAIVALERLGAIPSLEVAPRSARTLRPRPAQGKRYRLTLARQERLYTAVRDANL